jgi:predicted double-glycine peptidase
MVDAFDASLIWFAALVVLSILSGGAGVWVGRHVRRRLVTVAIIAVLLMLAGWSILQRNPALATSLLPLTLLAHLEGLGGVPWFMAILGLAWAVTEKASQRRTLVLAATLGGVFFLHNGVWMLKSTPEATFASETGLTPVMQSREYSCVPAACATALNSLGVVTSEAEMARLTLTREGSGSTSLRAMLGLSRRLSGSEFQARFVRASPAMLEAMPLPIVLPLRYEATRCHMVTVLGFGKLTVDIADPVLGRYSLNREVFANLYGGHAIVFSRSDNAGDHRESVARLVAGESAPPQAFESR